MQCTTVPADRASSRRNARLSLPGNRTRLRRAALVLLPAYLVVWFVISACDDPIDRAHWYMENFSSRIETELYFSGVISPDEYHLSSYFNSLFLEYHPIVTGPPVDRARSDRSRWAVLRDTTFGLDVMIPAGAVTVSGDVPSRDGDLPRKVIVEVRHLDADGKRKAKFRTVLKFRRDQIKELRKSFPGFAIEPGDRIQYRTKSKPVVDSRYALNLNTRYLMDFGNTGTLLAAVAGGRLPAPFFRASIGAGETATLLDTTYSVGQRFAAGVIRLEGFYNDADGRNTPSRLDFTAEHRDADDQLVSTFSINASVDGRTITTPDEPFDGFQIDADERLVIKVKPKGGEVDPADNISLAVVHEPPPQ